HLLDVRAQLACLGCVRRHLAPGGVFAFDLFDPKLDRVALAEEPETLSATFDVDGSEVRRWETVRRDHSRQVMSIAFRFEGGPETLAGGADVQMGWYFRYEIEHLLVRAGFGSLSFFGGFDRRRWQAGGETIVVAA